MAATQVLAGVQQFVQENVYKIGLALGFAWLLSKVVEYRGQLQRVSSYPGFRLLFFHPMQIGALFPHSWLNPSLYWQWSWRHWVYKHYGSETISFVPLLKGRSGFYTSNLEVTKQIAGGTIKTSFVKPEEASRALLFWGINLVAADGDVWKKHRRIMGPAFSSALYDMVWDETVKTYHEMIKTEGWADSKEIELPVVQTMTFKLALLIIGKCAFGFPFNWATPPRAKDGSLSLQEAFRISADSSTFSLFAPNWVKNLPFEKFRKIKESHKVVTAFIKENIAERRSEMAKGVESTAKDVFTMLLSANETEMGKLKLDEEELVGNIWIMMFAGHETTAHTFAATLGFLALYPEIQEDVLDQILSVVGRYTDPTVEHYAKLDKVLAVFYEALRMFPSGYVMIRQAKEDTTLQIPNPVGQEGYTTLPVPKGTDVIADMIGIQYNPRYFPEPEKFIPSRWHNVSNESEVFTAFSVGPRACLGRKFATTEAVAFLTMLLRDYEVHPLLSSKRPTVEKWREEVMEAQISLTMGIKDVPVRLIKRRG